MLFAGFILGIAILQYSAELPALVVSIGAGVAGLSGAIWVRCAGRRGLSLPGSGGRFIVMGGMLGCGIAIGWGWAGFRAYEQLYPALDPELEGIDLMLVGQVAAIPQQNARSLQIDFRVDHAFLGFTRVEVPAKVRLYYYDNKNDKSHEQQSESIIVERPDFRVGEGWQLQARLKRPHRALNFVGPDGEYFLLQQGIGATGSIRQIPQRLPAQDRWVPIGRLRQVLYQQIMARVPEPTMQALIIALAIGETSRMTTHHWVVLQRTGTSHLLAISGLQVALVAGFGFWFTRLVWAWAGWGLYWPAPKAGAVGALLMAVFYAALADFAVSTQRALIMLAVVMGAVIWQRAVQGYRHLEIAFIAVLGFDPLALLDNGFWLSFVAVGFILYTMQGRLAVKPGLWWRWGRLQWILSIALVPLLFMFFQSASLLSPLANFIAVPWVSFWIVPLVLLMTVLLLYGQLWGFSVGLGDHIINGLLSVTSWSLSELWCGLEWAAQWPFALWHHTIPAPAWGLLALVGLGVWFLPKGCFGRWLGWIWVLPVFVQPVVKPQAQEFWLTLLDVGQGLALMLQTRTHSLIYDTGGRWEDSDWGQQAVVPALYAAQAGQLDRLIISHADNDHAGGAASVLAQFPPLEPVLSGTPQDLPAVFKAQPCAQGQRWEWDGVVFEMLYPAPSPAIKKRNAASCVLQVSSIYGRVLLTGDIEETAEKALLKAGRLTAVDAVIAPHHGSRSSSGVDFVGVLAPKIVLISAGYRNAYHHPHPEVVARYQQQGAQVLTTATQGAIQLQLTAQGFHWQSARWTRRRYWQWQNYGL